MPEEADVLKELVGELAGDQASAAPDALAASLQRLNPALKKTVDRGLDALGRESLEFIRKPSAQTKGVLVERMRRLAAGVSGAPIGKALPSLEVNAILKELREGAKLSGGSSRTVGAKVARQIMSVVPARSGALAESVGVRTAALLGGSTTVVGKSLTRGVGRTALGLGKSLGKFGAGVGAFFAGEAIADPIFRKFKFFERSTVPEAAALAARVQGGSANRTREGSFLSAAASANPTVLDMIAADPSLANALALEGGASLRPANLAPTAAPVREGTLTLRGRPPDTATAPDLLQVSGG